MNVFISYSRSDQAIAHLLSYILRTAGIRCYVDRWVRTGHSFNEEIKEMIKKADLVLVLLTNSSQSSAWVNQEIGFAIAHDKHIWPLALEENLEPTGMIATTESYCLLDWSNPFETIENLVKALRMDGHETGREFFGVGIDHVLTGKIERTKFLIQRLHGFLDEDNRHITIYHQAAFTIFSASDSTMYPVPGIHSREYIKLLLEERKALDALVSRPNTTFKLVVWPARPYPGQHMAVRYETLLAWLRSKEHDPTIEFVCGQFQGPRNRLIVIDDFVLEGYKVSETPGYEMSVVRYQPARIQEAAQEFELTWKQLAGGDNESAIQKIEEMYQRIL